MDIYGVIGGQKVNTLDHLGFEYNWSSYSPTKKSEILEAERGKDELRDILSRVIGAEIRYTQLGYWMRQAPYGYVSEKVDTKHGKRTVLRSHPTEAAFVKQMYKLRAEGYLTDKQIVAKLNNAGFKTRLKNRRSKHDKTKIVAQTGGKPLTVKAMQKFILKPVNAGINVEKWTDNKPIKSVFDGLVSIALFNKASRGKKLIEVDDQGDYVITKARAPQNILNRGTKTHEFAYRRFVLCPECERPLLGSSTRGNNGKYYPAYHCSNHGHYFRVNRDELEQGVQEFVRQFIVPQERIDNIMTLIQTEYDKRYQDEQQEQLSIDEKIASLRTEAKMTVDKLKVLTNNTALKYMEEDLVRIEKQMDALKARKDTSCDENTGKIRESMERVRYFLENLEKLLIKQGSPERKARFFRALFTTMPTYENIKPGNTKTPLFTGVNSLIALLPAEKSLMVSPRGFTWKQIRLALAQLDLLLVDAGLVTETTNATTITNQINQHEQTYRFTVV